MCYCEEGVCLPWRKEKGGLALLLKAGAQLNLSGGKEAGKEASPEHWTAPSGLMGGHGRRPNTAMQLHTAWQDTAALRVGAVSPLQVPPRAVAPGWALPGPAMPCTAGTRQPAGTAPHRPEAGFEGSASLCRSQDTAKGAAGLLRLFPERQRTSPEKFASATRRQEQPVPPLRSTKSCTSSETGSENFLSCGSEGTGVLPFCKAQGKPGADEKALASAF